MNLKKDPIKRIIPLVWKEPYFNEELNIQTCLECHKDQGLFARGKLKRTHFMSIKFLVENKKMPPWPYKLNPSEQKEMTKFLKGL